jgi:nitroreductase
MDLIKAIKERRSVRRFKPDPVSNKDLIEVLEAARWAPSWANVQCWRFVVVTDAAVRESLASTVAPGNRGGEAIKQAPVLIVACSETGKSGLIRGAPGSDKGDWYMFDLALALQNLTLAAHSLGLGTLHVGWFDAGKAAEIINVPPGAAVVELMPLGYPDGPAAGAPRKSLDEIVFYGKYGGKK